LPVDALLVGETASYGASRWAARAALNADFVPARSLGVHARPAITHAARANIRAIPAMIRFSTGIDALHAAASQTTRTLAGAAYADAACVDGAALLGGAALLATILIRSTETMEIVSAKLVAEPIGAGRGSALWSRTVTIVATVLTGAAAANLVARAFIAWIGAVLLKQRAASAA
jgi:hypothetical protein